MIAIEHLICEPMMLELEEFLYSDEFPYSPWSLHCDVDNGAQWTLRGYFESKEEADAAWNSLRTVFKELPPSAQLSEIASEQWENAYKVYLQPWSHGPLHWIPAWMKETYALPGGAVGLLMDAGMAFGTGSHETTRLCAVRLIEFAQSHRDFARATVIDAGCGSGILALSAYQLGFRDIAAFDIDPQAIAVSRENQGVNDIPENAIQWAVANLKEGLSAKKAQLILANIQTDVLIPSAPCLLGALSPCSTLVLSGILTREAQRVIETYRCVAKELGLAIQSVETRPLGEWSDVQMTLANPA